MRTNNYCVYSSWERYAQGTQKMVNENLLRFPERQSEKHTAGPLDFTQLQAVLSIAKPHGEVVGVDPQLPLKAQNLNTQQRGSQLLG